MGGFRLDIGKGREDRKSLTWALAYTDECESFLVAILKQLIKNQKTS